MQDDEMDSILRNYAAGRDPALLGRIAEQYLPLCRAIARRYSGRGVETEDLEQVAAMALVKAAQRFEPERGLRFTTFATPTILGEVRNYIRDQGNAIRLGRDTQTMLTRLNRESDRLTQSLQRQPTLRELAEAMAMTPEALLSLLDEREMSSVASLNAVVGDEEEHELAECLGGTDAGFEDVERRSFYDWAMSQLTSVERRLGEMRFRARMSQREIAAELGVSQMQVSRMERRMLERLRKLMRQEGL